MMRLLDLKFNRLLIISSVISCNIWASNAIAAIYVSTPSELQTALRNAEAGETIMLAPGEYGVLFLYGRDFGAPVLVQSIDPADPAVFSDIYVNVVDHLHFENIHIDAPATQLPGYGDYFRAVNSSDIQLRNSVIGGTDDGINDNDDLAITLRNSVDVKLENSIIHNAYRGVLVQNSDNVVVQGNGFTEIRSDGIIIAGSQNVLIDKNICTNFRPIYDDPNRPDDHADCIQMWNDRETRSNEDITISGNVVLRGEGERSQGIFINGVITELPHKNLVIEHNVIHQSMGQGIHVTNAQNVMIRNNTILEAHAVLHTPRLELREVNGVLENVTVTDNLISLPLDTLPSGAVASNNIVVETDDVLSTNYIGNLVRHGLDQGALSEPADFIARTGVGASQIAVDNDLFQTNQAWISHSFTSTDNLQLVSAFLNDNSGDSLQSWFYQAADADMFDLVGFGDSLEFAAPVGEGLLKVEIDDGVSQHSIVKTIYVPDTNLVDVHFTDGQLTDDALNPIGPVAGTAAGFGNENGLAYARFNGLRPSDGGAHYTFPRDTDLDGMVNLALSLKVRRTESTGGWEAILDRIGTYSIWVRNDQLLVRLYLEGQAQPLRAYIPASGLLTGAWSDLEVLYDGESGEMQVVVNGIVKSTLQASQPASVQTINQWLYLGGNPWGSSFLGDIASFKIKR